MVNKMINAHELSKTLVAILNNEEKEIIKMAVETGNMGIAKGLVKRKAVSHTHEQRVLGSQAATSQQTQSSLNELLYTMLKENKKLVLEDGEMVLKAL